MNKSRDESRRYHYDFVPQNNKEYMCSHVCLSSY
jgi:hypothetical protein